jgi:membrane protease YdiL (CAAX protease family)
VELLRTVGPALAALGATLLFDRMTRRRGLDPPGFGEPVRRLAGLGLVAVVFYLGVFAALGSVGRQVEVDFAQLGTWQLFLLHGLFALSIAAWWLAGFHSPPAALTAGLGGPARGGARFAEQLGFRTPDLRREAALGVAAGFGAWLAVLCGVFAFALALSALSGEELLPQAPPPLIPWLAAQPILLRLAIAASAGFVEETFFRGFLQPRIGIALSTLFFALAHLSYDQPVMLVGVTLLSLLYGALTRWRQNIWPAIVAHFLFDAIQLLVVIPAVLELFRPGAE